MRQRAGARSRLTLGARVCDGLTKLYGTGCPDCLRLTGPELETNTCPSCGTLVACAERRLRPAAGPHARDRWRKRQRQDHRAALPLRRHRARRRRGPSGAPSEDGQSSIFDADSAAAARAFATSWRDGLPAPAAGAEPGITPAATSPSGCWRPSGGASAADPRAGRRLARAHGGAARAAWTTSRPLQRRHAAARPDRQGAGQRPGRWSCWTR